MNRYSQQSIQIDLKDLMYVLIKKAWVILLAGIVFSGTLFAYLYASRTSDANALDTSIKLANESDVAYNERIRNVNRAEDVISSIAALNNQINSQREYISNSIIMQIDFTNEAVSSAQLIVTTTDSSSFDSVKALYSAYSQDLMSGDYLVNLADELGTEQVYLKELITVSRDNSNTVVINSEYEQNNTEIFLISVKGPDTDFTDIVLNSVLEEVNSAHEEYNKSIASHKIDISGKQSYYMFDSNTRDLQHIAANRSDTLQKQIDAYDLSLNDIATKIGVSNKSNIYAYFSFNDVSWVNTRPSIFATLKSSIKGFVIGVFLVVFVISVTYVFGKRFSTQGKFFGRFPSLKKIGVIAPGGRRSRFSKFIDCLTGDDINLSLEDSYKLISANINNISSDMVNIIFLGTIGKDSIIDLVSKLNINANVEVKESFFNDPSSLENLSNYDGVILVEQRKNSDCKLVSEQLRLIDNANIKLIGAIII